MISCEWIEYGLTFGTNKLHHCCISHHGDLGYVPICDYNGGPLPIQAILEARAKLKKTIHPGCQGCCFLKDRTWRQGHLFEVINFSHFTFCNLRCDYCYLTKDLDNGGSLIKSKCSYDVNPVIRDMIASNQLSRTAKVYWGGGEPLLLEGFDQLLIMLLDHGTSVTLNSNGTVFSDVVCDQLTRRNLHLVISIDAGSRESYQKHKRRDLYDKVRSNLSRYAAKNGSVWAKYILTENNCSEAEFLGFAKFVKDCGIARVVLDVDFFSQQNFDQSIIDLRNTLFRHDIRHVNIGGPGLNGRSPGISKAYKPILML